MKREIKYRQPLFTENGKFGMFHYWGFDNHEIFTAPTGNLNEFEKASQHQQFTGLKDKNGVEIYEGDIVTFSTRRYHFGADKGLQTIKFKSAVVWEDCGFCVSEHQENDTYLCAHDIGTSQNPHGYEVIGNIYQNPKL